MFDNLSQREDRWMNKWKQLNRNKTEYNCWRQSHAWPCQLPAYLPPRYERASQDGKQKPKVPKVIFQVWRAREVGKAAFVGAVSFFHHNPDYEYQLWTDADVDGFVGDVYGRDDVAATRLDQVIKSRVMDVFRVYPSGSFQRREVWKMLVLERYGGGVMDFNLTCLNPLPISVGDTAAVGFWCCNTSSKVNKHRPRNPLQISDTKQLLDYSQFDCLRNKVCMIEPRALAFRPHHPWVKSSLVHLLNSFVPRQHSKTLLNAESGPRHFGRNFEVVADAYRSGFMDVLVWRSTCLKDINQHQESLAKTSVSICNLFDPADIENIRGDMGSIRIFDSLWNRSFYSGLLSGGIGNDYYRHDFMSL